MKVRVEMEVSDEPGSWELCEAIERGMRDAAAKILRQTLRKPGCVCTHAEDDDILRDTNGNRIGTVAVEA